MEKRSKRATRAAPSTFRAQEREGEKRIEGYFAVFGSVYTLWPGATESIAPGAFDETLDGDIRALIDHETRLVLGRTKAGTLELRTDAKGLWGSVRINEEDTDALNLWRRVARGDVDQCSFGFSILGEEAEFREDGSIHWTIQKVKLYEVSCVTFPAYEETSVSARKEEARALRKRKADEWRERMKGRLRGAC